MSDGQRVCTTMIHVEALATHFQVVHRRGDILLLRNMVAARHAKMRDSRELRCMEYIIGKPGRKGINVHIRDTLKPSARQRGSDDGMVMMEWC